MGTQYYIGLMSGTSLDGVDGALIAINDDASINVIAAMTEDYADVERDALRSCLGLKTDPDGRVKFAEEMMTDVHTKVVKKLLAMARLTPKDIKLVGFHGQTIYHDPAARFTWQIGDGGRLARATGINVINDFRSADVAAGGQGAPLLPLYHRALALPLEKPVAIVNIGGVSNITYIDTNDILAFDTGPGNALMNDWVKARTGAEYDKDGLIAGKGKADAAVLQAYLAHQYFSQLPPKSLDRDQWTTAGVQHLSLADATATLAAFTIQSIVKALDHLPQPPKAWYITGGGRHNKTLMQGLRDALGVPVEPVEALGWNGDSMEAEGFAYLGALADSGKPISLPTTTGVPQPMTGGRKWSP